MGSTNYTNTLIQVAEDCPADTGQIPPEKAGKKSVANLQFDFLNGHPYEHTSDDVLFSVYAIRKEIPEEEWAEQREIFFSKGQPCFRASPLTKRYGWGIHSDEHGRIALVGQETEAYEAFENEAAVVKVRAMRTKKA